MFLSNKPDKSNEKSYFILTFVLFAVFFVMLFTKGFKTGENYNGDQFYGVVGQSYTFNDSIEVTVDSVEYLTSGWDMELIKAHRDSTRLDFDFAVIVTYSIKNNTLSKGSYDFKPKSIGTRMEDGLELTEEEIKRSLNSPYAIGPGESMDKVQVAYGFKSNSVNVIQILFEVVDEKDYAYQMYITDEVKL